MKEDNGGIMAGIRYSIRQNQLKKALLVGMEYGEGDSLHSNTADIGYFVLPVLDSGVEDCPWGRLHFELDLPELRETT